MNKQINIGVIGAGGQGTRFRPFTKTIPKELLPIDGIPAIEFSIKDCIEADIKTIYVVIRNNNDLIYRYLSENPEYAPYVQWCYPEIENEKPYNIVVLPSDPSLPYGNAGSILSVRDRLEGEAFVVSFPDDIILGENVLQRMKEKYYQNNASSIVTYTSLPTDRIKDYGNLLINQSDGKVLDLIQKPQTKPISNEVLISKMILNDNIFTYLDKMEEKDIGKALSYQLHEKNVYGIPLFGEWICVDSPQRYFEALQTFYLTS